MLTNDYSLKLYMTERQESLLNEAKITRLRKSGSKSQNRTGLIARFVNVFNSFKLTRMNGINRECCATC